jgi:hypothetical protein
MGKARQMSPIIEKVAWACPECHQKSPADEWRSTEVGCEDCGSHAAIECPKCEEVFDLIFRDEEFPGIWPIYWARP